MLDADKDNEAAKAGIEKIHNSLLQQAGTALDRGNEKESTRLLAALDLVPHSADELTALQEREKTLTLVTPLVTRAADLLRQGHAIEPANDNALAVYRQVVKLDPANKLADQGLGQIERDYLDRALAAAAQDDFAGADKHTGRRAATIRPGSHELLDTRTRIEAPQPRACNQYAGPGQFRARCGQCGSGPHCSRKRGSWD